MKNNLKSIQEKGWNEDQSESNLGSGFENLDLQDEYERNSTFVDQLVDEHASSMNEEERKKKTIEDFAINQASNLNKSSQNTEPGNLHYLFILILIHLEKNEIYFYYQIYQYIKNFRSKVKISQDKA